MKYRLLAADYDLTLTGPDHRVTERTRSAILRVFEVGNYVTLATGRLWAGAKSAVSLFPEGVPLILCNGGVLCRSGSGEILYEQLMDDADARTVLDWCAGFEGAAMLWNREGLFSDRFNEATEVYTRLSGNTPRPLAPEDASRAGVYKILLLARADTVARARAQLKSASWAAVDCFTSSPEMLEIVPRGVNKGSGLEACARLLGLDRAETMAVGDGENDIPMLRAAGLGVAMGNADETVKAAAALVAPPCQRDGAAWLMENYLI
ncbi:MAG: HAD family phosphatase [Oscillospiraceae bacterium]|nr:HAD family phosphatase [Oscillospiraceae bacterium]